MTVAFRRLTGLFTTKLNKFSIARHVVHQVQDLLLAHWLTQHQCSCTNPDLPWAILWKGSTSLIIPQTSSAVKSSWVAPTYRWNTICYSLFIPPFTAMCMGCYWNDAYPVKPVCKIRCVRDYTNGWFKSCFMRFPSALMHNQNTGGVTPARKTAVQVDLRRISWSHWFEVKATAGTKPSTTLHWHGSAPLVKCSGTSTITDVYWTVRGTGR